jgi:hypothetical protein
MGSTFQCGRKILAEVVPNARLPKWLNKGGSSDFHNNSGWTILWTTSLADEHVQITSWIDLTHRSNAQHTAGQNPLCLQLCP